MHSTLFVPLPLHSAKVSSIRSPGSVIVIELSFSTRWMSFTLPGAANRATDVLVALAETLRVLFPEAAGATAQMTADAAAAASASRDPEPMSRS